MDTRGDGPVTERRRGGGTDTRSHNRGEESESGATARPTVVSAEGSGDPSDIQIDTQTLRHRAVELVEEWESENLLDRVRARTRTVTAVALGVVVVSGILSGSTTGITATIASAWLAVSGVVAVTVGAVTVLLRGLRNPREITDKEGLLAMVAIAVLALGGTHYARSPATRAAWRYLVTGPPRDGFASADGVLGRDSRRDAFPLRRYVRLAGGLSAAVVVLHQGWLALAGRNTVLSSVVGAGSDAASGSGSVSPAAGLGTQLTAVESALVLFGVVAVGAVIGALLAASRTL